MEQRVSLASAEAVWNRLVLGLGQVTPAAVLARDSLFLRRIGLSQQKAGYVLAAAQAQLGGTLDLPGIARMDDAAAIQALTALRGVGLWTAETYLMMCEGRLDVFPGGDIALQEAIRWADRLRARPDQRAAYARAESWRPYRAVATHLLWAWYLAVRDGAAALD